MDRPRGAARVGRSGTLADECFREALAVLTVTRDGVLWPKDLFADDRCVIHWMPGRPALRAAV
jgi:hypothetical protein